MSKRIGQILGYVIVFSITVLVITGIIAVIIGVWRWILG